MKAPMDISDIAPDGWQLATREKGRVTFRTAHGNMQTTLSTLATGNPASLADFEKICQHRLSVERTQDVTFTTLRGPTEEKHRFVFEFIGVVKPTGRMFSGLMIGLQRGIQTLYVESFGVDANEHLKAFHTWRQAIGAG